MFPPSTSVIRHPRTIATDQNGIASIQQHADGPTVGRYTAQGFCNAVVVRAINRPRRDARIWVDRNIERIQESDGANEIHPAYKRAGFIQTGWQPKDCINFKLTAGNGDLDRKMLGFFVRYRLARHMDVVGQSRDRPIKMFGHKFTQLNLAPSALRSSCNCFIFCERLEIYFAHEGVFKTILRHGVAVPGSQPS